MKNFSEKKITIVLGKSVPAGLLADPSVFSIECGQSDGVRHFDHHGLHAGQPSPCNDGRIQPIKGPAKIFVSHFDADTWLGLCRLCGYLIPALDLCLLEKIDCNGTSVVQNPEECMEIQFAHGLHLRARNAEFPNCSSSPEDITQTMDAVLGDLMDTEGCVEDGRDAIMSAERTYKAGPYAQFSNGRIGLWEVKSNEELDPSRPYRDGFEVVIVWRGAYNSISLYANPSTSHVLGGRTFDGLLFQGHEKACGSERGKSFSIHDAYKVGVALAKTLF